MAHNCENCKFRAHYDKGGTRDVDNIVGGYQPNSFLAKFFAEQSDQRSSAGVLALASDHRSSGHINFCPGWKGYFTSQSEEKGGTARLASVSWRVPN